MEKDPKKLQRLRSNGSAELSKQEKSQGEVKALRVDYWYSIFINENLEMKIMKYTKNHRKKNPIRRLGC